MPLFEIAIMEVPTKKEIEEGTAQEKLVFGPAYVIATDTQKAAMKTILDNSDTIKDINRDRMQVLVRPFA